MVLRGDARRDFESRRRDEKRREQNDIGEIPPIQNPERRKAAEKDPVLWLTTYLPEHFFLPFSQTQERFVRVADAAIRNRAWQNVNACRGFGKTTDLSGLMLKAHLTGWTRYGLYIVAVDGMCGDSSNFFSEALFEPLIKLDEDDPNDNGWHPEKPLCQDYPEVCYPIACRDGVAQRPLMYHGRQTKIVISPNKIVFPVIPGSKSSGSILYFVSISSREIRGRRHIIPGEGTYRPDIVMLDDIQSDGVAKSEVQVSDIMTVIRKSVEGLAGSDRKTGRKQPLIILSALTQNQPLDVAIQMKERPEYCTQVYSFLKSTPTDFSAWKKYRDYRADLYFRHSDEKKVVPLLKRYYTQHREELEENCVADNPESYTEKQVSAIHYALDFWCTSGEAAFWCELQNDANRASQERDGELTPVVVIRKKRPNLPDHDTQIPLKRYWLPKGTVATTAFIDCGEHYLNYEVLAFGERYSWAHVVDFGIWPDQDFPTTSKKSYRRDLQDVYRDGDKFDRLRAAVVDCLHAIFTQQYFDHRGKPTDVHRETEYVQNARGNRRSRQVYRLLTLCGVDCGDGEMEYSLWKAIDEFHRRNDGEFFGRAIPTYGAQSESRLMRYYQLHPGEWRRETKDHTNCDWIENPIRSKGIARNFANIYASLLYDANTAKTRRNSAWMTPVEKPGSETLFDWAEPEYLKMFAEQQCSETYKETWKSNLKYLLWGMKKPRVYDNEFLDTDAGCWALADYIGLSYATGPEPTKHRRRVIWK